VNTQGKWLEINSKSVVGETALSLAASHAHLNIVEFQLKDSRPGVTATDNLGQTVLCKAARNEYERVVKRFYRDIPAKGGGDVQDAIDAAFTCRIALFLRGHLSEDDDLCFWL
jgi:hypothetical protein